MSGPQSEVMTVIKTEVDSEGELEIAEESSDDSEEPINAQVVMTTNFHDTRLPMLEDFRGPYNFTYKLPENGQSSIKPTWEYSKIFNQVFIKMDRVLIVQFTFDTEKVNINDLYIRAVLVYSSADHIFSPVNRCAVHAIEEDPLSKSHSDKDTCLCPFYEFAGHVVRCKSTEAMYCYDPKSERHSVLCPVRTTADLLYSFRCKNSCPKGMHRRTTKLVFTLENGMGKMLGRRSLDVKICSCPRRDKEKMEKTLRGGGGLAFNTHLAVVNGTPNHPSSVNDSQPTLPSPAITPRVPVQQAEEVDTDIVTNLPGEVIMKMRSEIRNIRQALVVIERRCSHLLDLVKQSQDDP
uniref:Cellular tumor antigen p53 n=2 Tax=Lygus hesperus TaxID=30085 RepID=A0A0A9XWS0_LYGHE